MHTAFVVGMLLLAPTVDGKKPPSSTHHCVKDGAEVVGTSKKECKKQGGTWERIKAPVVPAPGAAGGTGSSSAAAP
jgi:hypothetical protein